MIDFDYLQPKSIEEASGLLTKAGTNGMPFGGGTDAVSLLKENIVHPEKVVNLKKIEGMNKIDYKKGEGLSLGSLVTITDIAENKIIAEKFRVLSEAANRIASPQLRNVGTLGGNLSQRPRCWYFRKDFDCIRKGGGVCYAYDGENKYHCITGGGPCYIVHPSDTAVALLALDAKVKIVKERNSREIPISDFFILPEEDPTKENILMPGEIVTEVFIPEPANNTKSGYVKFMERDVWDFAIVSVAAVIQFKGNKISSGKIAFGGVAPVPWTDEKLNLQLNGLSVNDNSLNNLTKNLFADAEPLEQNGYKIPLAKNLVKSLIERLDS